jgi:hypothetical protein
MPQLDKITFFSQITVVSVFFFFLFIALLVVLPLVFRAKKVRNFLFNSADQKYAKLAVMQRASYVTWNQTAGLLFNESLKLLNSTQPGIVQEELRLNFQFDESPEVELMSDLFRSYELGVVFAVTE